MQNFVKIDAKVWSLSRSHIHSYRNEKFFSPLSFSKRISLRRRRSLCSSVWRLQQCTPSLLIVPVPSVCSVVPCDQSITFTASYCSTSGRPCAVRSHFVPFHYLYDHVQTYRLEINQTAAVVSQRVISYAVSAGGVPMDSLTTRVCAIEHGLLVLRPSTLHTTASPVLYLPQRSTLSSHLDAWLFPDRAVLELRFTVQLRFCARLQKSSLSLPVLTLYGPGTISDTRHLDLSKLVKFHSWNYRT